MRPSQQKNRMRGRGRKQPNPLSRNFESNGPDVKIRGNASHIADKYATLARDATASGDRVMAENYLQHAEHYNRIIAAATAAANRNGEQAQNAKGPQPEINDDDDAKPEERRQSGNEPKQGDEQPVAEGSAQAARSDAEERPKRDGQRRRRPRKAESQDSGETNGAVPDNGKGSGDPPGDANITDDAAKLPGSLIGVSGGEPQSETESAQKD